MLLRFCRIDHARDQDSILGIIHAFLLSFNFVKHQFLWQSIFAKCRSLLDHCTFVFFQFLSSSRQQLESTFVDSNDKITKFILTVLMNSFPQWSCTNVDAMYRYPQDIVGRGAMFDITTLDHHKGLIQTLSLILAPSSFIKQNYISDIFCGWELLDKIASTLTIILKGAQGDDHHLRRSCAHDIEEVFTRTSNIGEMSLSLNSSGSYQALKLFESVTITFYKRLCQELLSDMESNANAIPSFLNTLDKCQVFILSFLQQYSISPSFYCTGGIESVGGWRFSESGSYQSSYSRISHRIKSIQKEWLFHDSLSSVFHVSVSSFAVSDSILWSWSSARSTSTLCEVINMSSKLLSAEKCNAGYLTDLFSCLSVLYFERTAMLYGLFNIGLMEACRSALLVVDDITSSFSIELIKLISKCMFHVFSLPFPCFGSSRSDITYHLLSILSEVLKTISYWSFDSNISNCYDTLLLQKTYCLSSLSKHLPVFLGLSDKNPRFALALCEMHEILPIAIPSYDDWISFQDIQFCSKGKEDSSILNGDLMENDKMYARIHLGLWKLIYYSIENRALPKAFSKAQIQAVDMASSILRMSRAFYPSLTSLIDQESSWFVVLDSEISIYKPDSINLSLSSSIIACLESGIPDDCDICFFSNDFCEWQLNRNRKKGPFVKIVELRHNHSIKSILGGYLISRKAVVQLIRSLPIDCPLPQFLNNFFQLRILQVLIMFVFHWFCEWINAFPNIYVSLL